MENEKGIIKIARKQLYDEIWTMSVSGVAKKYNLNYSKLIETCKQENIPFPSSGFWTRKNMGKDITSEIVPLPESDSDYVSVVINGAKLQGVKKIKETLNVTNNQEDKSVDIYPVTEVDSYSRVLDYLEKDEREKVIEAACSMKIIEGARLHQVLVKYKKTMSDYRAKLKEAKSQPYYNPRYNKPDGEPVFFSDLSEEGVARTIAILNALYKTIESLGGSVNDDLTVTIHKDSVRFRFAEGQDKVKHEITKKEAQELVKYEDYIKHGRGWVSKPQIRQYDHVFNGKLRVVFGEKNYMRDNESQRIEDRLGDILIELYDKSEENRIERERREEAQRIREEEQRRKEEIRKRKELEIQLTKELANKAEDYRIACDIRSFIKGAMESGNEEYSQEWVEWARSKADWYDPTIAADDLYLGKREHGKSKEEKEIGKQDRRTYGSWW